MGHVIFSPSFDAWRFYAGGDAVDESTSTPLENEDTDHTADVDAGDVRFHFRFLIQENGGASGGATDDYGVEISVNGGGYIAIAADQAVTFDSTSGLTDGAASTNRAAPDGITDGGGAFVVGEQIEGNNIVDDHQLIASRFTEHVGCWIVQAANVSNGDTIDFRITYNGGSPGMVQNVTPRINITKTPPVGGRRIMVVS